MPTYKYPLSLLFDVAIDSSGQVTAINCFDQIYQGLSGPLRLYMKRFQFEPAKRDGKAVSSHLVGLFEVRPDSASISIRWPVDEKKKVTEARLFELTLNRNDFRTPTLIHFPSYFSDVSSKIDDNLYPYLLYKVNLDSTGKVLSSAYVLKQKNRFASQIQSAIRYASFSPLLIDSLPRVSEVYLLVSFLPELTYPTNEIEAEDSLYADSYYQRLAVKVLPIADGVLMPPVIKHSEVIQSGTWGEFQDTVICKVVIDELGFPTVIDSSFVSDKQLKTLSRYFLKGSYYPAFTAENKGVQYEGWILFYHLDSVNIRIDPSWDF